MPASSSALPPPPAHLFARGLAAASIGAVALVTLLAFESMAVAAAMPAIADALSGIAHYALAFGGMLASSVLGLVWAGRAADRDGAFRVTAIGLVVFTIGLLLAGFAPQMGWLVAGRIVQGLGSGMLGVALYVGMGQVVPPALHPRLFALMAAAWVLPGLVGPLLAAWLVEQLGWRSVFLVVAGAVPLAAGLLLPAFGRLSKPPEAAEAAPLARVGWALLGAAGALLLHAAGHGGGSGPTLATIAALLLGLAAAGAAALRLLPRGSLLARPGLPAVIALRGLLAAAFASAEVFLPLFLTHEAGWSLTQAGLTLSAGAVLWSAGSAVQARIEAESRRRQGLQAGFVLVALGLVLATLPMRWPAAPMALVAAGWSITAFGIGLAFPMLSVLTLRLSPPAEQGRNASALQLADALCCSATLAMAGALFMVLGHASVMGLSIVLAATGAVLGRRAFAVTLDR